MVNLQYISVNPDKIRVLGQLYDNLIAEAEETSEEDEQDY